MNAQAKQNLVNRHKTLAKNIVIILILQMITIFVCYVKARYDVNSYALKVIKIRQGDYLRYSSFSLCRPIPGYIGVYVFHFHNGFYKYFCWAITKDGIKVYKYSDF